MGGRGMDEKGERCVGGRRGRREGAVESLN